MDNGGQWEPGTVLAAYPVEEKVSLLSKVIYWIPGLIRNRKTIKDVDDDGVADGMFNPRDKSGFLLLMAHADKYKKGDLQTWRLYKKVDLTKFMSRWSIDSRLHQRLMHRQYPNFKLGVQPRWTKSVNLDAPGVLQDTPEWQHPKKMEEPWPVE